MVLNDPDALITRAAANMARGDSRSARVQAAEALKSVISQPERLLRAATRVHELGLGEISERAFRRAVQRQPRSLDLRFRQAVFHFVTGRLARALDEVEDLLAVCDSAEAHALRGMILRRLGRKEEAALALQTALRAEPLRVEWWNQVGDMRLEQKRISDAIRAYNTALQAAGKQETPPSTVSYTLLRLADCFARSNMVDEAWRFSEGALATDPNNIRARWSDLHLLPISYRDQEQIETVRRRYEARLSELEQHVVLSNQTGASSAVASMKLPFYLHYQGGNMRPVMQRFGRLTHRCVTAWRPDLAAAPRPRPAVDGRIRVGFCSYLFRQHTITKLFGGWIRDLDRTRFSVHVFHLGPTRDAVTEELAAAADSFHHLVGTDAAMVCTAMRDQQLDVAVFPELGMATTTYQVAAMRVAPIQAVAWGHPITSGLPNVDWFLSSEAMEPPDGDAHYTEELIRLPGLSIKPAPPADPSDRDRSSFGLEDDDVVYLVPQSLFKLLPTEDSLYVRILKQVPKARLVFLHNHSEVVTGLFRARLAQVLKAAGLDAERRLVFVPQLSWADYLALNRCSDVFLDGLTWSGGMTTLEALAMDLVPVTLPGGPMRARHTAAILRELDVTETIAQDRDEYVQIAVSMGLDQELRQRVQARVAERLPRLYEDDRAIHALEELFSEAVHQRKPTVAVGTTV